MLTNYSNKSVRGVKTGAMKKKKPMKAFKPCASCPNPEKCKKAGKCMLKARKKK